MAVCDGVVVGSLFFTSPMSRPLPGTGSDSWFKSRGHKLRYLQDQAGSNNVQIGPGVSNREWWGLWQRWVCPSSDIIFRYVIECFLDLREVCLRISIGRLEGHKGCRGRNIEIGLIDT